MKFVRDDAKVGLLVMAALAVFVSLALHRTLRLVVDRDHLHKVELVDAADVDVGTEVQLQGLRVGRVESVDLERQGNAYRIVATVGVRKDVVLWRGTKGVVNSSLMGSPWIELRLPPLDQRKDELAPGELMPGEVAPSVAGLVADSTSLVRNLDRAVSELRKELQDHGLSSPLEHPQLRRSFEEVRLTLGDFRSAAHATRSTLEHGDRTLDSVDRNLTSLRSSLLSIEGLLDRRAPDLDAVIGQLGPTLKQVELLRTDVSLLIAKLGPEASESLRSLDRTLQSTQELVELLKAKPNRIVWGTPSEKEQNEAKKRVEESKKGEKAPAKAD